MDKSFTEFSKNNMEKIHKLSSGYNADKDKDHPGILLDFMQEHVTEIRELYEKKDKHFIIETGDLLVLCLELLKEFNEDADEVMDKCYKRFEDKLTELISSDPGSRPG